MTTRPGLSGAVAIASLALLLVGCGDGNDQGNPTAPTPTPTSVSVTFPAGGTFFIGRSVQFEARETLSNGTTRLATSATWGSDAPGVATVSSTGLVTAVSPGEATIFANVDTQGVLRIRVFPGFGGTWAGSEVIASCEDSGAVWVGFCDSVAPIGRARFHASALTQTEASVGAVLSMGGGASATFTGTIAIGGLLQLPSTSVLPADPLVDAQVQNWRSQADVPSQMTGTYDLVFTAHGVPGALRFGIRLQDVLATSAPAGRRSIGSTRGGETIGVQVRRWIANHP